MANTTSADLKLTIQATGENSGTWGQITNTNLTILEQAIAGYEAVGITTGVTLAFTNGAVSNGKNQVLKLTGTIAGAVNVVVPDTLSKVYVIDNATSGSHAVTVKTTSGTGVTWAADDKGTKMVYSDGTNVVDTAFTDLSSDYTPQLSADLDTNGNNIEFDDATGITDDSQNEQLTFSKTTTAVNNIQVKNAATSGSPEISAIGGDTNIDLTVTPKGTGNVVLDGLKYPNADGSADEFLQTDGAGNLAFAAAGGGYESVQVFTSSGTYTKPAAIKKIRVIVTGGGGGGGSCPNSFVNGAGQGGGAGGTAIETIDATSITTETVTIGAGGAIESGGSTSSFGAYCSGAGGSGGRNADSIANPPGGGAATGSGGDYNLRGGNGGGGSKGTSGNSRTGGFGGNSFLGGGGFGSCGNTGGSGLYGGGGGGASTNQPATTRGGGTGGAGIVIVEEYK